MVGGPDRDVAQEKLGPLVDLPRGEESPGAVEHQAAVAEMGVDHDVGPQPGELFRGEHDLRRAPGDLDKPRKCTRDPRGYCDGPIG